MALTFGCNQHTALKKFLILLTALIVWKLPSLLSWLNEPGVISDMRDISSTEAAPSEGPTNNGIERCFEATTSSTETWDANSFPVSPQSFVVVQRGELPIVLSAPHGGTEKPSFCPDRTNGILVSDAKTIPLVQQLSDALQKRFDGRAPFVVYNRLHRSRLDVNRPCNEGTEGHAFASLVYDAYHDALANSIRESLVYSVEKQPILMLDLHGYSVPAAWGKTSWDTSWVIVGHLTSSKQLRNTKSKLNDEEWIRGSRSLGSLLEVEGILAEPSSRQPFPSKKKYFHGGYITKRYRKEGLVQTIQMEFPLSMRNKLDVVVPRVAAAIENLMIYWEMMPANDDSTDEEDTG